jgi:TetR/AcrR family transcriptional regulator, transcriptional repressor for nem operon
MMLYFAGTACAPKTDAPIACAISTQRSFMKASIFCSFFVPIESHAQERQPVGVPTYRDKHALFLAALRMYDNTLRSKRLADLESRYGPREAIRQLFLGFTLQVSEKGGNRGCFLTNTALELAAHDPEARDIVAHAQKEMQAFFARMIRKGKAQGEVAPHVKPAETASGLLASLIGLVVLTRSRPERALLRTIVDDAVRRLD